MTYRGQIKNGQVMLDESVGLPEGAVVEVEVLAVRDDASAPARRKLLRMSIEERRRLLMRQAERVAEHYGTDPDRLDWQSGDIVEE